MGIFRKKEPQSPGLLGIDVGAGGIKLVELVSESGRPRLSTYGYSDVRDPANWKGNLLDDTKKGAEVLQRILKDAGVKSTHVNASLPSHAVFHAIITVPQPKSAAEDLRPAIEGQVKKLLPMPLEKMILDITIIDKHLIPTEQKKVEKKKEKKGEAETTPVTEEHTITGKHVRVLVSGAARELVDKYVALFKAANLHLQSLETEAFALIRSLVGRDKARIMIVDIGYERTNITIVQEGIPFLHRSIKAGGLNVTQAIQKQMGISADEAEQAKMDLALSGTKELPPVLIEAVEPILHEIRYSLTLYSQQVFHANDTVEKIIITGGSSHLPNIDRHFSKELDINVYLGDPWARIMKPSALQPVLDEIGPRFSVAIGLAMKE